MDPDTVSGASGASKNPKTKDPDAPQESPADEEQQDTKPLDANRYATKKTIAQGMLDIALLTANASQLKYILQVGPRHEFYSLMLGLISTSMILQVLVGIMFLVIGALNINKDTDKRRADILNDIILIMVFIISVTNVVIAGFGIDNASRPLRLLSDERGYYSRR